MILPREGALVEPGERRAVDEPQPAEHGGAHARGIAGFEREPREDARRGRPADLLHELPQLGDLARGLQELAVGDLVLLDPREVAVERERELVDRRRARLGLGQLLGGRVLAWLGGIALCAGLAFLLALAISRGWLGEGARCVLGAGLGAALVSAGVWLRERRGSETAGMAATRAGILGLFASAVVATAGYGLLPPGADPALAGGVGVLAVLLALRWDAQPVAALGLAGALLAPYLVAHSTDVLTLAFAWLAALSAAAVARRRRWGWLSLGVFALVAPLWAGWALRPGPLPAGVLLVLLAFGLPTALAAAGYELGKRDRTLRAISAFCVAANALVLGVAGALAVHASFALAAPAWLLALAVGHLALGLAGRRSARVSPPLRLLALALAAVLHGPAQAGGWALAALGLAALGARRAKEGGERSLATLGLGAHIGLTLVQVYLNAGPSALGEPVSAAGVLSLGRPGLRALRRRPPAATRGARRARACGRRLPDGRDARRSRPRTRLGGRGGRAASAGPPHAGRGRRRRRARLSRARRWARAPLGGAPALALRRPAGARGRPPRPARRRPRCARLGGTGARPARALWARGRDRAHRAPRRLGRGRGRLRPGRPGARARRAPPAQLALSVFWALTGLAGLIAGLRLELRAVRLAALGLLLVAMGKVVLVDLSTLTSIYHVASFLALGVLLLTGAVAWERARGSAVAR